MLCHDWRSLGVSAEEVRQFCVWREGGVSFFSCQEWNASAWSGREAGRALARASFDFFPAARREPGPAVGRTAAVFWEGFLLFFPCPPGGGLGGEPQARSSSFAFFFSRFLRRSRRPPPSKRRREAEFNSAKARFFPFVFPFFPLAWQDRARVELAVKARSSSLGCRPFFFPVRTRSSTLRRPVPPWRRHGCWPSNGRRRDPFFFRGWAGPANPFAGGRRSPRRRVSLPSFPPFWGGFSSGGPRPAINCFHTYPPPYIFFHLPSSTLICFHHFSTFLSVHLIRFFIIIFPKFSPSFSPFSSPHSFHHIPLKMSFPQSPHLIHFKKINFAKYIAKNICHQKNIRTV